MRELKQEAALGGSAQPSRDSELEARVQLAIVVHCYNEQEVLCETATRLLSLVSRLEARGLVSERSAIYFIDDGSADNTWQVIEQLARQDRRVRGLKLSRNRGHQQALLAGLFAAEGDAVVSVDADLQDDIAAIEAMVLEFVQGAEIVYGVRSSRASDSVFKRRSARAYYSMLRGLGVEIVPDHADFRLMSRRAIEALGQFSEVNLFLRGVIPLLGFRSATVHYDRAARFAGESKYPLKKMISLALDGVTSFSVTPLRIISALGFTVCVFSACMVVWVLYGHFATNATIPGWASSVLPMYFLGGVQLLSIGVVGEYVAKIYLETKRRPRFLVEKSIGGIPPVKPAHVPVASPTEVQ